MTLATLILVCLVAAFVCAAIGAARAPRDPLHVVGAVLLAIVLVLMFVHWRSL